MKRSRGLVLLALATVICGPPASGAPQDAVLGGTLRSLRQADARALEPKFDQSLLPAHSRAMQLQTDQAFRIQSAGLSEMLLLPVHFAHGEVSQLDADRSLVERDRCGVFLFATGVPQQFIFTITDGDDLAVDQCSRLLAVRRLRGTGARPVLRLTYRTFSPPRFEDRIDVTLTWDPERQSYRRTAVAEQDIAVP